MRIEIPYYKQSDFLDSLGIDTPENCTIQIVDVYDHIYYLSTYSKTGITYILTYGPVYALGDEIVPFDEYPSIKSIVAACSIEKLATNTKHIAKAIRMFLQKHSTVQARLLEKDEEESVLKYACEPIIDIFRRVKENDTRTND